MPKEPLNKFTGSENQGWFSRNQMRQHLIWRRADKSFDGLVQTFPKLSSQTGNNDHETT